MTTEQIITEALRQFAHEDTLLIEYKVGEVSMAHKIAQYLGQYFVDRDVDIEYNKKIDIEAGAVSQKEMPKKINAKPNSAKKPTGRIRPDIIVHERGRVENNRLVIEIKKSNNLKDVNNDHKKLKFLTSAPEYKYEFGALIVVFVKKKEIGKFEITMFSNGMELEGYPIIFNAFK